ncbi:unnamed protein product [Bursaphelenchus okinawaensis]|uniref:TBC1 domain family member 23 n=1 Tax=Bursaphelenchus okinawaensis TaxID=465554 RepID=A0A811KLE2_9BILA|nr:unnamed protein product [Bursaphelenchus okinawaensis]CAG9105885.1 unnamed protein product [Bursaphelenchus okinawaensis]
MLAGQIKQLIGLTGLDIHNNEVHKNILAAFQGHKDDLPVLYKLWKPENEKPKLEKQIFRSPKGIIKRDWPLKYLEHRPAVIVLFLDLNWDHPNWAEKLVEVESKVASLKQGVPVKETKIALVLIQNSNSSSLSPDDYLAKERSVELCQSCQLNDKQIFVFPDYEPHNAVVKRMENGLYELGQSFYQAILRRVRLRSIPNNYLNLTIRQQFKLGFLSEMRQDTHSALRPYRQAYQHCADAEIPDTELFEYLAVVSLLSYKICELCFLNNLASEAVNQFRKLNASFFNRRAGYYPCNELAEIEIGKWKSQQCRLFADLFSHAIAKGLAAYPYQNPGLQLDMAADFLCQVNARVALLKNAVGQHEITAAHKSVLNYPEDSLHPVYFGQRPWRVGTHMNSQLDPIKEHAAKQALEVICQPNYQQSLTLFSAAMRNFQIYRCNRMQRTVLLKMADEYFNLRRFQKSMQVLVHVVYELRRENVNHILFPILQRCLDASYCDGDVKEYIWAVSQLLNPSIIFSIVNQPYYAQLKLQLEENFNNILNGVPPKTHGSLYTRLTQNEIQQVEDKWQEAYKSEFEYTTNLTRLDPHLLAAAVFLPTTENRTVNSGENVLVQLTHIRLIIGDEGSKVRGCLEYENIISTMTPTTFKPLIRSVFTGDIGTPSIKLVPAKPNLTLIWPQSDVIYTDAHNKLKFTLRNNEDVALRGVKVTCRQLEPEESQSEGYVFPALLLCDDHGEKQPRLTKDIAPYLSPGTEISFTLNCYAKCVFNSQLQIRIQASTEDPKYSEGLIEGVFSQQFTGKKLFNHKTVLYAPNREKVDFLIQSNECRIECVCKAETDVEIVNATFSLSPTLSMKLGSVVAPDGILQSGEEVKLSATIKAPAVLPMSSEVELGKCVIRWKRPEEEKITESWLYLGQFNIQQCPLKVEPVISQKKHVMRKVIELEYKLQNLTEEALHFKVTVDRADSLMFSGYTERNVRLAPHAKDSLKIAMIALGAGQLDIPRLKIEFPDNNMNELVQKYALGIMTSASSLADDAELLNLNESGATSDDWVKDLSESSDSPSQPSGNNNIEKLESLSERWEGFLGVRNRPDPLLDWDQLYNLKNQAILRKDTRKMFESLHNCKIPAHEVESLITLYCKKRHIEYETGNGWLDIIKVLLHVDFDASTLYNVFYAITTKYIPRSSDADGKVYDLFRLILQYHDPQLCSFLDSMKIQPQHYAKEWFTSLMSKSLTPDVCRCVWDLYFQQGDPFLLFFVSLSFLQCAKENIMKLKNRDKVIEHIVKSPKDMSVDDIPDLFDVCVVTMNYTPISLRRDFHCLLFGANLVDDFTDFPLNRIICLPVSTGEIYKKVIDLNVNAPVQIFNYFIIDTRPHDIFVTGSILGAYNLNGQLIIEEPENFKIAMTSLLQFKQNTHPKDHICFVGSGDSEEDATMFMVIARFLQQNIPNISYVDGGFKGVHLMLQEMNALGKLNNHIDPEKCAECCSKEVGQSLSIMEKMKRAVQAKKDAISTAVSGMVESTSHTNFKHAKPSDRNSGKRYKNMHSVFTINNSESESSGDEDMGTGIVAASKEKKKWLEVQKQQDVFKFFEGHEVFQDKTHTKCFIVVSYSHMLIYHDEGDGYVKLTAQHSLSSIVRVTSKRKVPEFLTFKFGYENAFGETQITRVHCFLLAKSGDCAQAIKQVMSRSNNVNLASPTGSAS